MVSILLIFQLWCMLLINFSSIECAHEPDLISHLPGLNNVINFKHYSGYLDGTAGDHLHYW